MKQEITTLINELTSPLPRATILGISDPRGLSEGDLNNSQDVLYHGSSKYFIYSQNGEFNTSNGNSATAGAGFYCTTDESIAKSYAGTNGHVAKFIPFGAKMLDCTMNNKNIPLPICIVNEYINIIKNYSSNSEDWKVSQKLEQHIRWVKHIELRMSDRNWAPNVRELLQTCPPLDGLNGYYSNFSAPPIPGVFEGIVRNNGFDGVIFIEGIDNLQGVSAKSYVFYNPQVLGTFENWQLQNSTRGNILNVLENFG